MKELVLSTIQNYGSDPEETAAEESWDYAQFQVSGPMAPPRPPELQRVSAQFGLQGASAGKWPILSSRTQAHPTHSSQPQLII